ncbi:hybrid sensor histidine kinase/response regulator [Paludisphaera soli]|uniref:hybrid sensor histidine kinase/response regulator n=1 Tax=Paludisphaera soli TaxID=2712865 RepID=UPI001F1178AE|nr:response regulator [Paludisphaera soli]
MGDPGAGGATRVLLVDDLPKNLLALEAVLGGMGLDLARAGSGEEALRQVLDGDFAVILMDVQMPGMDGFEAAELIRRRDRSSHTPIIFLTAFQNTEGQAFQGYALGAVDFLSKPIVPAVLRSKVAVFVELHQKTDQVRRQAAELVENQRREHDRALAEERGRWEVERLRAEAAREREAAGALARTVSELTRAETDLRARAAQQAIVSELGHQALAGAGPAGLMNEAVAQVAGIFGVRYAYVAEAAPGRDFQIVRAGFGWAAGNAERAVLGAGAGSIAGFTLLTGEPVVAEDLQAESRFAPSPLLRDHGVAAGLCVPIQGREGPYGTLGVFSDGARTFARDDVHFLQSVANVLAAAVQRRRDEDELAAVRDELAAQLADMMRLHALVARLSTSLELTSVLEEVLSAVLALRGSERGVLTLRDADRDAAATAVSMGFTAEGLDDGLTAPAAGAANSPPCAAPHRPAERPEGDVDAVLTPLLTSGGVHVGSIAAYFSSPHRPTGRETRLVELYARQAGDAIDNARLYRAIRDDDRRKGEFLAMLAHELRNPLSPLLHALQMLGPGAGPLRDVAERQARHLVRLVDDLLDVSRISTGKIELRRGVVDLREAVAHAAETARPLIESRRHELTITLPEEPIPLEADAARLEQILVNLLNNAAKYTEPGGLIAVEARREGEDAVVRVQDSGVGIEPELLPRIFDLFTQAGRSLDRSQGGLGVGLTLVRRLVQLHGGEVSAGSPGVGRGSEFVVRLPIRAFREGGSTQDEGSPPSGPGGRGAAGPKFVLIVDDNADAALTLARLLESSGHRVEAAHDGPAALERAGSRPPDVVLLDIGLPGMDGYEVARRLRASGLDRAMIVALTGYGQEEDRRRSREAGMDAHLTKPVDLQTLNELFSLHRPPVRRAATPE